MTRAWCGVALAAAVLLTGCDYDNGGFGPSRQVITNTTSGSRSNYDNRRGEGAIHIRNAAYQSDDGRRCDARGAVRQECEGEDSCSVEANNNLCGDPARSHRKVLSVEYDCGGRSRTVHASEKRSLDLSCD